MVYAFIDEFKYIGFDCFQRISRSLEENLLRYSIKERVMGVGDGG